jgi:hypothetical protein
LTPCEAKRLTATSPYLEPNWNWLTLTRLSLRRSCSRHPSDASTNRSFDSLTGDKCEQTLRRRNRIRRGPRGPPCRGPDRTALRKMLHRRRPSTAVETTLTKVRTEREPALLTFVTTRPVHSVSEKLRVILAFGRKTCLARHQPRPQLLGPGALYNKGRGKTVLPSLRPDQVAGTMLAVVIPQRNGSYRSPTRACATWKSVPRADTGQRSRAGAGDVERRSDLEHLFDEKCPAITRSPLPKALIKSRLRFDQSG